MKEVGRSGYVVNVHQSCRYIYSGWAKSVGRAPLNVLYWALLVKKLGQVFIRHLNVCWTKKTVCPCIRITRFVYPHKHTPMHTHMHTHIHTQLDADSGFDTSQLCGCGTCPCHFDISVSLPVQYQQCSPFPRVAEGFSGKCVVRCGAQGLPQQEHSSCGCFRPLWVASSFFRSQELTAKWADRTSCSRQPVLR